jgi:putative aldouronate transport system substrate-binding protein
VFSFVNDNADQINANNPAGDYYEALAPLKGPNGVQYATYKPSVANISFMISRNCKNPDAAFRVGDFMASEVIGISQRFGAEGIDWDYAKNVPNAESTYVPTVPGWPLSIITYNDTNFWGGSAVSNNSWRQIGPLIRAYGIVNGWGLTKETAAGRSGINARISVLYQEGSWKPKEVIPKLIYNAEEVSEITELLTNLENYTTSTTAAFLSGNSNIDSSWNAYQAELNNIGLPRALSIIQKVYDRMYK